MPGDQLYKVAFDEAVHALSEQQTIIDGFRNRAGILLSAAAVTTSFLGAQALQSGDPALFSWLALGGFAGVAAASLAVLWPRKLEVAISPHDVLATYIESAESVPIQELHQELSIHMHTSYLMNQDDLEKLVVFLQVASLFLAVEAVLWMIAIATTS